MKIQINTEDLIVRRSNLKEDSSVELERRVFRVRSANAKAPFLLQSYQLAGSARRNTVPVFSFGCVA
jgi:hypothetical protein